MAQYSEPAATDNIRRIQNQLDEVKSIMMQNIETLLERGESLDQIVSSIHYTYAALILCYSSNVRSFIEIVKRC